MSIRRCLLFTYRFLLQLYPCAFRERFAPEMLELAEAAEPTEWPLIFSDTSVAIVRCWLEPAATSSTVVPAGQDAYLALGESSLPAARLIQGLVLSTAIILGLCYAGSLGYVELPKCHAIAAENVSR
ncbi:MAG: hypothetical protein LAO03_10690 [Acidobacteriia bacterium]|nr:hypothetical protein [Terriglobia bacterium]